MSECWRTWNLETRSLVTMGTIFLAKEMNCVNVRLVKGIYHMRILSTVSHV